MEENIKVVVRIRPLQLNEKKKGDYSCVKPLNSGKEVQIKVGPLDAQTYKCHKCFPIETTQEDFFAESGIVDLLDSSIAGYHSCAFAFGQTGAGKTYTMIGPAITTTNNSNSVGASTGGTAAQKNNSYSFNSVNFVGKQSGMIIKSLNYLYQKLAEMNVKYKVSLSCIEIYQENVFDLLSEEKERSSLAVREHATKGFFLEGCKLVECVSYDIACAALEVAMKNRSIGSHELNNKSSRSHCLTEIHIELPVSEEMRNDLKLPDTDDGEQDKRDYVLKGRMYLVDLAGSERLKGTNSSGKILQEAGFINKSLYVLGKVIAGLVRTNGDLNHKDVPFRDSKLTKLLISSLGGKSRTLLISCVTEAKGSQAETLRTLKFR